MLTHAQGFVAGTRQGTQDVTHSHQFDPGDTPRELGYVEASVGQPIVLDVAVFNEVAVAGGNAPSITVGTTSGGTEIGTFALGAAGAVTRATVLPVFTTRTKLFAAITGAPTTARAHLLLRGIGLNRDKRSR